jgi:glutathione peroxidase
MKYLLSLITCLLLFSFQQTEGIYDLTLTGIDGNKIELSQFKGKKLLFILLPLSAQDTTVSINDIASLQRKYQSSLVIIGIPSEEAGYQTQDAANLKKRYNDAGTNIIITEGMKVKKGAGQSLLLQWLTSKDKNHHFDQDVQQKVGSKFFVDETGELYAVMGPQLKLTSTLTDKILSRQPSK